MIYNAEQFLLTMHFNWKARFIWRFRIWCLPQKASRAWFREVSSDKQRNKTRHTAGLSAMSFMASYAFYWRHFDRSSSIWIHLKWRRWLVATNHQWHINSNRCSITLYLIKMCKTARLLMSYQANCMQPIWQMRGETIL